MSAHHPPCWGRLCPMQGRANPLSASQDELIRPASKHAVSGYASRIVELGISRLRGGGIGGKIRRAVDRGVTAKAAGSTMMPAHSSVLAATHRVCFDTAMGTGLGLGKGRGPGELAHGLHARVIVVSGMVGPGSCYGNTYKVTCLPLPSTEGSSATGVLSRIPKGAASPREDTAQAQQPCAFYPPPSLSWQAGQYLLPVLRCGT